MASYFVRNNQGIFEHERVSEVKALTQEILESKAFKVQAARFKADATKITTFAAKLLQDNRLILSFYGKGEKVHSFEAWTYNSSPKDPEQKYFYDAALFFLGLSSNRPTKPSSAPTPSSHPQSSSPNPRQSSGQPRSSNHVAPLLSVSEESDSEPEDLEPTGSNSSSSSSSSSSSAASSTFSSSSNSAQIDQATTKRIETLEKALAEAQSLINTLQDKIAAQNASQKQPSLPLSTPPNLSRENIEVSKAPFPNLKKKKSRRVQTLFDLYLSQQRQIQLLKTYLLELALYASQLKKNPEKEQSSILIQEETPTSSSAASRLPFSQTTCSSSEALANSSNQDPAQEEINKLRNQIKDLQQLLEQRETALTESDRELVTTIQLLNNTRSELRALTAETNRLRESIQHRENGLREHIQTLQKELAASTDQAIQNQSELDDAALQRKELEETIEQLRDKLNSLQLENESAIQKREKQIAELANLLEKTQSQQEELARKIVEDAKTSETAIKQSQAAIENHQHEIELLDKKLKDAESEKTKLAEQANSYAEQISSFKQSQLDLEHALRETSKELSDLKIEKTSYLAELEDLRTQIISKTTEVYNLQKTQNNLAIEIETLKTNLKQAEQENSQASQHKATLKAELQEVTGILQKTAQEKNQLLQDVQAHKEHIEHLTRRIVEQTEQHNHTHAQYLQEQEIASKKLNEAEVENSSLKARIAEIEESTKLHGKQLADYRTKIESYFKEKEDLLAKIKQLETQLATNAQSQKNLQTKNSSSTLSLSAQRAMLNKKVIVNSQLSSRLKKYFNRTETESESESEEASSTTSSSSAAAAEQVRQKEITTLREENAKLLQTKRETEKQLKALTEQLKSLEEQLGSASRENTRLQEHYREEFSRSSSALLMQEQSSKEETENLKAEIEALKHRWDIQQSVIQDLKELLAKAMSKNEPEESESELEPTSTSSSMAASSQPTAPASTSSSNSSNEEPAQNAPAEEATQAPQTFSLWEGSLVLPGRGTNRSLLGMARSIAKSIRK